jgi:hypothetical protein
MLDALFAVAEREQLAARDDAMLGAGQRPDG